MPRCIRSRRPSRCRPAGWCPGLPRDIETIAIKCLRKDPRQALRIGTGPGRRPGAVSGRRDDPGTAGERARRGWRWCRRNPALAWSLGAVAAAVLALVGLSLLYANQQVHFARSKMRRRKEADLELAISDFERGEALCEKGELGTGPAPVDRELASGPRGRRSDPGKTSARNSLSCWQREYAGPRAVFSHEGRVALVAFSPDGQTIVTCGGDNTARLWNPATGRPGCPPLEHKGPVTDGGLQPRWQDARHRQL